MAHIMNELPDITVRLRAEPADEFSARVLGVLAPGAFQSCSQPREGGMCGCGEPEDSDDKRLTLRLPPYMTLSGAVQIARISGQWSEVFPGLQCQVRRLANPGEPEGADLEFRLTPPEG
jgi:hypothetical protein